MSVLRQEFLLLLAALVVLTGSGCANRGTAPTAAAPLHLFVRLDAAAVRPGEAVVAEVLLLNAGGEAIRATPLNHESVSFWLYPAGSADAVELEPVFSDKEPVKEARELERDGLWARRFVLTRAAVEAGAYTVQATYSSDPARLLGRVETTASRPVALRVEGERALERDRDGVILSEEAVRIARGVLGEEGEAEARLVVNEAGFLDWMVRVTGTEEGKAVLVNPYLGKVRGETEASQFPERDEDPGPRVFPRRAD
jgi:hypothetical protein